MSVSLLEVIEAGGYDLSNYDDCKWLVAKQEEFEELIEKAEEVIEEREDNTCVLCGAYPLTVNCNNGGCDE